MSHLNEGSVPDLAVQCSDMRSQVHVQQEVVLEETQHSLKIRYIPKSFHNLIISVMAQIAEF